MGLFDGLMGNASEVSSETLQESLGSMLVRDERVEQGYKVIRDMIIFTDKRLILIDKQGITGSKAEYYSVPYSSITHFSVETAGTLDLDSDLKIFIRGGQVISKKFKRDTNLEKIHRHLAEKVL